MRKLIFMLALSLALVFTAGQALADTVYMRSNVGAPWGQNTNEQAMDQVFGAGNWDDLRYETGNVAAIFSGANEFVFMEGETTTPTSSRPS